ncbi:MAG: glycosyltransferase [Actinomycetes bacterium]
MRVAQLLPNFASGGAERVTLDLAVGMVAAGVDVDVVVAQDQGPLRAAVPDGVRVVDLHASRVLRMVPSLRRYLRSERPDVVISHITHTNLVASVVCRTMRPRMPLLLVHHNTLSNVARNAATRRDRLAPRLVKHLYLRADAVVTVSQGVADDLVRITGLPPGHIHVLYNPVVFDRILARAAEDTGHPWLSDKTGPVLLAAGRLHPQKDFATLLRALARLPADHRLIILGEGELRGDLERLAGELGVAGRVDMPGFLTNPYPYMRTADALVVSSQWEGLALGLVEAMPFDTQLVSTDCDSGPREILDDGKWGTLVPVGDTVALAEGIARAVAAPVPARPPEAWQRFDVATVSGRYLDLIRTIVRPGAA